MSNTEELPPWLEAMPPAHCPEGCIVRKGGRLGVVTYNCESPPHGRDWRVVPLGEWSPNENREDSWDHGLTPEAAGWRHALDHRSGFGYVLQEVRKRRKRWPDTKHSPPLMLLRWSDGEETAADRLQLARVFAAVLR